MKGDGGLRGPVRKALLPFLILGTLILVIHAFLTLIRREPVIYWEWPHRHEAAEWKISPGIRLDKETEGGLAGTIRSSLASLDIPAFHNFPATAEDVMEIKLKVAGIDYEGEENRAIWRKRGWFIHWLNDKEVAWSKDRRTSFYPYQDEAWHTYMIPLGREPGWRGNISSIQLILQRIEGSRFSLSSVRLGRHLPAPHLLSRVSGAVFSALSRGRYFYFPLFLLLLIYPLLLDAGKTRWIPLFVFCLAFVIRILFILDPSLDGMVIGDQARMDFAAQKIVAGKDLMGDIFWPPVWQYSLAFLYLFFGHSYLAVRIFLACVGAAACLVVFQLGKEIMGEKAGYLAGLLLALSAGPIFYSGFLFADSLNAALTVASFLLLHYALKPGASIATLILTGMLFGVTALTRSEIAGFLPVIFFLYYVTCRRLRIAIQKGLIIFIAAALTILPKTALNYIVYERFVPINIGMGMNLYLANKPSLAAWRSPVLMDSNGSAAGGREPDRFLRDYPNRIDRHKALLRETRKLAWENPAIFFKNAGNKFIDFFTFNGKFFNDRSSLPFRTSFPFFLRIHPRHLFLMSLFLLLFLRSKNIFLLPAILYTIYFAFVHSFFLLDPRYHLAIIPFLCLFSACFLVALFRKLRLYPPPYP